MSNKLQQYNKAAIEKIETVSEAVYVKNMADAAVEFYNAQKDFKTAQEAKMISIRSSRQAGKILLPPAQGGQTERKPYRGGVRLPEETSLNTPYQQKLEEAAISGKTAHTWQKVARVPEDKVEAYFAEADYEESEYSVTGLMQFAGEWYGTSNIGEWETPQWLFDLLDKEFGFDLDVCALPENTKCTRYFTPEDNGLTQPWDGVCWMNPPYGTTIKDWMGKAKQEAINGSTVVCLVPARPDTNWWWDNGIEAEVRFIKGRLQWPDSDTAAPFPSAVIVMRPGLLEKRAKVVWWNVQPK